jgi:hypothetical protein
MTKVEQLSREIKEILKEKVGIMEHIQEVIRFETWWSRNLTTVVSGDCPYSVWLIVYEPKTRKMKEVLEKFAIDHGYDHNSLESSKKRTRKLIAKLDRENPILALINPRENISISKLIKKPYILESEIPHLKIEMIEKKTYTEAVYYYPYLNLSGSNATYLGNDTWLVDTEYKETKIKERYPDDPDSYLKPLDIVKVRKKWEEKVCFAIYLGGKKVGYLTSDSQGARIRKWKEFLVDAQHELTRIHLVIPFRKREDIITSVSKTVISNYKKGEYSRSYANDEHYVWEQIIGINYSQQAEESLTMEVIRLFSRIRDNLLGKQKSTALNSLATLVQELEKNKQKFEQLRDSNDQLVKEKINEIKLQTRIEIPPIVNQCRIM